MQLHFYFISTESKWIFTITAMYFHSGHLKIKSTQKSMWVVFSNKKSNRSAHQNSSKSLNTIHAIALQSVAKVISRLLTSFLSSFRKIWNCFSSIRIAESSRSSFNAFRSRFHNSVPRFESGWRRNYIWNGFCQL